MKKVLLLLIITPFILTACRYAFGKRVRGNGNVINEVRLQKDFTGVASFGPFDVYLNQDSTYKVTVEAEENLLPYIETYVDGGVLKIRTKEGYWIKNNRGIRIHITAPSYSKIRTVGSGDIISENKLNNSSNVELQVKGSGNIKVSINAPEIKTETVGSGNIEISGEAKDFKGEIRGSGDIHAYDLKTENASIDILGSGNADVNASGKVTVDVKGSGDVRYKGNAQLNSSIHGSGSVTKVD